MQVVERRREQAAEVVEPRREQAAEVVERRLEQATEESSGLNNPFPHSGNDSKEIPARAGRPGRTITRRRMTTQKNTRIRGYGYFNIATIFQNLYSRPRL